MSGKRTKSPLAVVRESGREVSAYDTLGRVLASALEVLHMADRRAALKAVTALVTLDDEFDALVEGLDAVGAIAFARDLREHRAAKPKRRGRRS